MNNTNKTFKDLNINDSFDFINNNSEEYHNSKFKNFKRCIKTNNTQYKDIDNNLYTIGTIDCPVFHIKSINKKFEIMCNKIEKQSDC